MRYMFLQKSLKKYYLIQHFLGKVLTLQMFYDKIFSVVRYAQVAELADAQDLKSCGTFSRAGSTPALSTTSEQAIYCLLRFLFTKIRAWQCAAALPLAQIPIVSEKFI